MNTKDGISDIAVLGLSCRPQRSLNLHLVMERRGDTRFVDGEDCEFRVQGCRGSGTAASQQLPISDSSMKTRPSHTSFKPATWINMADQDQAKSTCAKYCPSNTWITQARCSMTAFMTCATARERLQLRWLESCWHPWVLTAFETFKTILAAAAFFIIVQQLIRRNGCLQLLKQLARNQQPHGTHSPA